MVFFFFFYLITFQNNFSLANELHLHQPPPHHNVAHIALGIEDDCPFNLSSFCILDCRHYVCVGFALAENLNSTFFYNSLSEFESSKVYYWHNLSNYPPVSYAKENNRHFKRLTQVLREKPSWKVLVRNRTIYVTSQFSNPNRKTMMRSM